MSALGTTSEPASAAAAALQRPRPALEFLPAALEIVETPASPAARATALAISGFFVVALAWSIIGKVDIIASAPGSVIPAGRSKTIAPLEAGIVRAILVADGDHVAAGQRLITLDPTQTEAERDRLAADLRQARLDVAGLSTLRASLADGTALGRFAAPEGIAAAQAEVERANIMARADEQAQKLDSLLQQIAGKQSEAAENRAGVARLRASLPFVEQKRDMYRSLRTTELTPVPAWADAEQAAIEQQQQILVLSQHAGTVSAERAALLRDLAGQRATYAQGVLKDLSDAQQRVAELTAQLTGAVRRAEERTLHAPVSGTVQQLTVHTVGGVVTPAQALMTVVPDAPSVLIEAVVENKDVGFVHAGQDVEVKVETFTFTRYGLLHGHVVDVSRDAAPGQAGMARPPHDHDGTGSDGSDTSPAPQPSGYVAHVALDSDTLMVDGVAERLAPGMAVTAEIKTGQRSVISYLLSPLASHRSESFIER